MNLTLGIPLLSGLLLKINKRFLTPFKLRIEKKIIEKLIIVKTQYKTFMIAEKI